MEGEVLTLIDKLIACWSDWDSNEEYYLGVLAPNIVRSGGRSDGFRRLRGNERKIVTALRRQLSQREWQHLPALIAQRRIDKQKELDTARERAKVLEEAERKRGREDQARIARKTALIVRLKDVFESDFLSADEAFAADPDADLLGEDEYQELKTRSVRDWSVRELQQPLPWAISRLWRGREAGRPGRSSQEQSSCRSTARCRQARSSCWLSTRKQPRR